MPSRTVVLFFESFFLATTKGIMMIFCCRKLLTCFGIVIGGAIFLATLPAPGSTTPQILVELVFVIQSTCKNIVARTVFQAPTLTPGTLLRIVVAHKSLVFFQKMFATQRRIGIFSTHLNLHGGRCKPVSKESGSSVFAFRAERLDLFHIVAQRD